MVMQLTTLTGSDDSTVRIFTILSIGTVGIMIHSTTIRFIIPHIILLTIAGAGVVDGIHPITVGVGVIHLITVTGIVHIMEDTMEDTPIITVGMVTEIVGMPIPKITVTDREGPPERTFFVVTTATAELLLQVYVHQPAQLKVPAKEQPQGLQTMVADQLQVQE
jgi:hypothetical protein